MGSHTFKRRLQHTLDSLGFKGGRGGWAERQVVCVELQEIGDCDQNTLCNVLQNHELKLLGTEKEILFI